MHKKEEDPELKLDSSLIDESVIEHIEQLLGYKDEYIGKVDKPNKQKKK